MNTTNAALDIRKIREDFPILKQKLGNQTLVYLDNAATAQKPLSVLKRLDQFYQKENANVHRGIHLLSQIATEAYEGVRQKVLNFLGTNDQSEVIFTSGTTAGVNLVASSWGRNHVKPGDDIVVTRMEHHSNFVPWQSLAKETQANFKIVELTPDGKIDFDSLERSLSGRPKVLAITLMSNTLGTLNPIREIATKAKEKGAMVFIDGAQGMVHLHQTISDLGPIDFLAFSAHKLGGPTGSGVLWGRKEILEGIPPYQFGGDMILNVEDQTTEWNELPYKFEAGTPPIAGVIGMGAALDYYQALGRDKIESYEAHLTQKVLELIQDQPGVRLLGPKSANDRGCVFSFQVDGVHPHDLSTFLDSKAIAIRAGHHCNQPLMRSLGIPATARASALFYNLIEEFEVLFQGIQEARKYFS